MPNFFANRAAISAGSFLKVLLVPVLLLVLVLLTPARFKGSGRSSLISVMEVVVVMVSEEMAIMAFVVLVVVLLLLAFPSHCSRSTTTGGWRPHWDNVNAALLELRTR